MPGAHAVCMLYTRIPPLKLLLLLYYGAHRPRKNKIFISFPCSLRLLLASERVRERGREIEEGRHVRILQKSRSRLHFHFTLDFCWCVYVEHERSLLARHNRSARCIPFQHIKLDGFQEKNKKEEKRHKRNLRSASVHRGCTHSHPLPYSVKLRGKIKFKVRTPNDAEEIEMLCL